MPIATSRETRLPFHLEIDGPKPAEIRPEFETFFYTVRDSLKLEALVAAAEKASDGGTQAAANDALNAILAYGVTGWRNLTDRDGKPVVFDPAREGGPIGAVDDALTVAEKWELVFRMLNAPRVAEADSKNSLSASPSSGAPSAPAAPPAGA